MSLDARHCQKHMDKTLCHRSKSELTLDNLVVLEKKQLIQISISYEDVQSSFLNFFGNAYLFTNSNFFKNVCLCSNLSVKC